VVLGNPKVRVPDTQGGSQGRKAGVVWLGVGWGHLGAKASNTERGGSTWRLPGRDSGWWCSAIQR
jgi:hypothetical protein